MFPYLGDYRDILPYNRIADYYKSIPKSRWLDQCSPLEAHSYEHRPAEEKRQAKYYNQSNAHMKYLIVSDKDFFPDNFTLNLSSGSRYHNLKDIMKTYNFVRGEFIAVKIDRKTTGDKLTKEEKQNIRTKARSMGHKKIFICPGLCASCSRVGHACADKKVFQDYTIITPEH